MKNLQQSAVTCLGLWFVLVAAGMVCAQTFPAKPLRIIGPEVGGSGDRLTRLIAPVLGGVLGQQIVVENRGGGGGVIAVETVVKAAPDGYTLLAYGSIWILPLLRSNLSYDVMRDLVPVVLLATSPEVLVVPASSPVTGVADLIARARARPGDLIYGAGGGGSSSHLAAELFNALTGAQLRRVSYKGAGLALTALISGEVHLVFSSAGSVMPHVHSGRLRALAVTSAQPTRLLPGLPTIADTVRGYESGYMLGVFAPARTPPAILAKLNEAFNRALEAPAVRQRYFDSGAEAMGGSSEVFAAAIRADVNRLQQVIVGAGIRLD